MSDNVVEFPAPFDGTATEFALEDSKGKFESVIIIGVDANEQVHLKCSVPTKPEILWYMELVKKSLLEPDQEWDDE